MTASVTRRMATTNPQSSPSTRPTTINLPRALGSLRRCVQAFPELLAGLEERHELLLDWNRCPGARVAPLPRRSILDRERPEAAQLDPVAARQRAHDLIEDDIDDALDVAVIKIGVCSRNTLYEFGLDHDNLPPARH